MINVSRRDEDYDNLSENSSDLEKLNVVFLKLKKANKSPIWLEYDKLFLFDDIQKRAFDAKLINTKLVDYKDEYRDPTFTLNNAAYLVFDRHNSYIDYYKRLKEEDDKKKEIRENNDKVSEEKHNLEMQKLRTEVQYLTDTLSDYPRNKSLAKWAIIIAAVSALFSILQMFK